MEIVYETETDTFTFSYPWDYSPWDCLRSPFTTLSTVLSDIASGLGVEVSSLGLLTSLPLLTFAIFSPFAASWAKRFGIERLFLGVLIVMTLGSALRTFNLPLLYVGTILVGAGIAFLNVLLPSLIQANQPNRIGFLTTLYITSMGLSTSRSLISCRSNH